MSAESKPHSVRYSTIVADPPWRYRSSLPPQENSHGRRSAVPYQTLSVDEIQRLPVRDLAADDAHLFLWTTNTHLEYAWLVAEAWGFKFSTLLVWCKKPGRVPGFPTFGCATEFVLFCRRGRPQRLGRVKCNWFEWARGSHSQKPEAFLDLVEQVSPGPYLELFARRNRLGWDSWGNEALEHVELSA